MYPRVVLHILLLLAFCTSVLGQISISTSRADNIFDAGEEMNFIISSDIDVEVNYTISYDSRTTSIETGKVKVFSGSPAYIPFTLHEPGLVIMEASDNINQAQKLGVAFSPFSIGIYDECPSDFDAFWADQIAHLGTIPIDPELTVFESTSSNTTYRINLASVDNRRVYGYITVPNGPGPYPAILTLPPNGNKVDIANPETVVSELITAISMSISIHNVEPDELDPNAYLPNNTADREGFYYRTSILAAVRAMDYIFTRSDFDGENIVVTGVSQGGGLSMCVAGIDPRIKALSVSNPALCEHAGYKFDRASGFPYYNWSAALANVENIDPDVYEASKYYDAKYFAQRIDVPCLFTTGYQDLICPPTTVFGATNQLRGPKLAIHGLRLEHSSPVQYWNGRYEFFIRHIPAFINPFNGISKGYYADAGNDLSGTSNQAISISATTFNDDSIVTSWPARWELVSGPGKAVFNPADNRNTSVQFDQAGTYVLRFSSDADDILNTDGILFTMEDFITITVN